MHKSVILLLASTCILTESHLVKRDAPPPYQEQLELYLKMISDTIEPQFKAIFKQMADHHELEFKDIFDEMSVTLKKQLEDIFKQMTDNFEPQFQGFFEQMSDNLDFQYTGIYQQMVDNIVPQFKNIFEHIAQNGPLENMPFFRSDSFADFMRRIPNSYESHVEQCLQEFSDNIEPQFKYIFDEISDAGSLGMGPHFEPDTFVNFMSDALVRREAPGPEANSVMQSFQKHMEQFKNCIDQTLAKTVDDINVKQVQPVFDVLGDHLNRLSKAFEDLTATKPPVI